MVNIAILANSFTIGHAYLQYTRFDRCKKYWLCNHIYLISRVVELKDAIFFIYSSGLSIAVKGDDHMIQNNSRVVPNLHKIVNEKIPITCRKIPFLMMIKPIPIFRLYSNSLEFRCILMPTFCLKISFDPFQPEFVLR